MSRSKLTCLVRPLGLLMAVALVTLLGSSGVAAAQATDMGAQSGARPATVRQSPPQQGTIPPRRADLQITKRAVRASETITFTLQVVNAGPSVAQGAVVLDQLPRQVAFVSVATTLGRCAELPGSRVVACALSNLASGAGAEITIITTLAPNTRTARIRNLAATLSRSADPNLRNNLTRLIFRLNNQANP